MNNWSSRRESSCIGHPVLYPIKGYLWTNQIICIEFRHEMVLYFETIMVFWRFEGTRSSVVVVILLTNWPIQFSLQAFFQTSRGFFSSTDGIQFRSSSLLVCGWDLAKWEIWFCHQQHSSSLCDDCYRDQTETHLENQVTTIFRRYNLVEKTIIWGVIAESPSLNMMTLFLASLSRFQPCQMRLEKLSKRKNSFGR